MHVYARQALKKPQHKKNNSEEEKQIEKIIYKSNRIGPQFSQKKK